MGKSQYDAYSQTLKDLESALIYLEELHQEADNVQQLATYAAITTGAVTPTVEELLELSGNCYKRIQVQVRSRALQMHIHINLTAQRRRRSSNSERPSRWVSTFRRVLVSRP